jgi:CRP-like cAMP-binding protein
MITLRVKQGDILFRQDDESDRVLWVSSGEIEVLREVGGEHVVIGHARAGEWLGEMGVIENRPRSATARAASDGEVQVLTAREFLDRVSKDTRLAHGLLVRFSVRLRKVDDELAHELLSAAHQHHPGGPEANESRAIAERVGTVSFAAHPNGCSAYRDRPPTLCYWPRSGSG